MSKLHRWLSVGLVIAGAAAVSAAASAGDTPVDETRPGEQVERHLSDDQPLQWSQDPNRLGSEQGDRLEVQQVAAEELETVKLKNVVPPIRFESGVAKIPRNYVDELARILEGMRDRRNVRVHFVGHADSQPLSD